MRNEMVAQPAHARDRAIARANRRPNALSVCFLAKALPRTRPARDAPPLGACLVCQPGGKTKGKATRRPPCALLSNARLFENNSGRFVV